MRIEELSKVLVNIGDHLNVYIEPRKDGDHHEEVMDLATRILDELKEKRRSKTKKEMEQFLAETFSSA